MTENYRRVPHMRPKPIRYHMIGERLSLHVPLTTATPPKLRQLDAAGVFLVLVISVCYYFISIYLLNIYVYGDRFVYNELYAALSTSDFSEISNLQRLITGSGELLYGITIWITSRYLPNDIFLSIINAIMCAMLLVLLLRHRAHLWVIALIMTNFYFIVLITAAERLKFSVFILLAAAMVRARTSKILFLAAAPLFHVQTLIFYLTLLAGSFLERLDVQQSMKKFNRYFSRLANRYTFLGACVGLGAMFAWKKDYILTKMSGYISYSHFQGEIIQIAILTLASGLTFQKIAHPTISLAILWIPVAVLGGARVNMVACLVYLYYCMRYDKLNNMFLSALLVYFSYKSIGFINNIVEFGNGFAK